MTSPDDTWCVEWYIIFIMLVGELVIVSLIFVAYHYCCRRRRIGGYEELQGESKIRDEQLLRSREIHSLTNRLEIAVREKDEALSRLSEIAARKLKDDNTAIADLSTENRPTKIVERYKELYDNEWTEAFAELVDTYKIPDKDAIQFLLKILQDAYRFCSGKYTIRREGMSRAVKSPDPGALMDVQVQSEEEDGKLTFECADLVKQILKASAGTVVSYLQNAFKKEKFPDFSYGSCTDSYIRKCVEITWFMNVQLPPMVIEDSPPLNSQFDPNFYSVYTMQGTHVDYLVWPVCRVEKGGLLLSKGILQPI